MHENKRRYPTWLPEGLRDDMLAAADALGCELLEVERSGPTLRLVIDHPEGVTLELCSEVSRQVSALLDLHDFGDSRYVLEVSSPGLDRKLYDAADFERFRGSTIRVRFRDAETGRRKTVVGTLRELDENEHIALQEESTQSLQSIPLADVEIARLEPSFETEPQPSDSPVASEEAVEETT